jgi:hypothetical protein
MPHINLMFFLRNWWKTVVTQCQWRKTSAQLNPCLTHSAGVKTRVTARQGKWLIYLPFSYSEFNLFAAYLTTQSISGLEYIEFFWGGGAINELERIWLEAAVGRPDICLESERKITNDLSKHSYNRRSGRGSNQARPKYKCLSVPTMQTSSVGYCSVQSRC